MKYLSKIKLSIGFSFVLSIAVVMMFGFSAEVVKATPFNAPVFDPNNFPASPDINNPFLTLKPGTAFCYKADTGEDNEVTVTTCNQVIAGVKTIVVRDAVRLNGVLTEDTYDFFAQDDALPPNDGNVWYLAEATKTCADNTTEGTWNANPFDANNNPDGGGNPGIAMLAHPEPGNSYRQEFLEGVAEDMAKVLRLNATVSEYCEKDCLETKEWSPLEHGAIEHKFYAHDIVSNIGGVVRVEELKGKTVITKLVKVVQNVADTGTCPPELLKDALDQLCNEGAPPPNHCE